MLVCVLRPVRLDKIHGLVAIVMLSCHTFRRRKEGCRQRWRLDWVKFKKRMPKSRDYRESFKH